MLQNRVNPFGEIIKTPARGAWMGNRGLIHNQHQEIVRSFKLIPWITCVLEFKNRRREVMAPGLYTELFFLDEATAFSAGHRPCKECRRDDHLRFKKFWIKGNPEYGFNEKTSIGSIDAILHSERITINASKVTWSQKADKLPNGTIIKLAKNAYLLYRDKMYLWSPGGYGEAMDLPNGKVNVLTPRSIVNTFSAGYVPQIAVYH